MKEIQITKGAVAIIDDEDFELVSRYKWFLLDTNRKTVYAATTYKRKTIVMHRLILGVENGLQVDHRDHNGLNNTRSNLRVCTQAQNSANQMSNTGNSRFKGVCFNKNRKKFHAYIRANNKQYHLGSFIDEVEAATAYDRKAVEFFGEFACLNFPN